MFRKGNIKEYRYLNLGEWQKYTGKGIKVATYESVSANQLIPFKVYSEHESDLKGHAKQTAVTCLMTAPDITLYSYDCASYTLIERCIEDDIDILFASVGNSNSLIQAVRDLKPDLILITSAGNTNQIGGNLASSRLFISVGGVTYTRKGVEFADSLFDRNNYIDFATFGVINLPDLPNDKDFYKTAMGTSFSAPIVAGLVARVLQLCKERTGETLTQEEICNFLLDNCNMEGLAKNEVGNGVVSLPRPDDIDFSKYITKEDNQEVIDLKFKDVDKQDWFYEAVEFVENEGLMQGYDDDTFRPNNPITRAEVAQVLFNLINKM